MSDISIDAAVANGAAEWLDEILTWAAIPSVSADPAHRADVDASAEYFAAALRRRGFPEVEIWDDAPALPAIYAHWPSGQDDAVRVLVYGHHDVQPAEQPELWAHPPFEPRIIDGIAYGRGVSDDKGNIGAHLLGLTAHLAGTGRTSPAVDLTLLVEGEEESGSKHLMDLMAAHADKLACDVVVITDTGIFDADTPSVCLGMRGLVAGELHVHGPDIDLHSGSFGGAVPNPLSELARLVALLHDDNGHITVPGFYDGVIEPSPVDLETEAALPFDEAAFLAGPAASRAAAGEAGYTTLQRIGMRPTAEVNGIYGGYTGPGGKTIVPTDGYAKLSFRLVGAQRPAEVQRKVSEFFSAQARPGLEVSMTWEGAGVTPLFCDAEHPTTKAAQAALGRAFATDTVLATRAGGSGPEAEIAAFTGKPLVFIGVMTDADQIHAPNESARVDLLLAGCRIVAHLWDELAALGRKGIVGS